MNKKQTKSGKSLIPQEHIENKILFLRGHKVMLDRDLADLYGVETKYLTRQVRRNQDRFPSDFLLTLTQQEFADLKCHFGTSSWGGTRKLPFAFTEHGILMLSSILNSERAIQVNIQIMRAFVKLRELIISHKDLAQKLDLLERRYNQHDKDILVIFETLRRLMNPPKKPIGFHP